MADEILNAVVKIDGSDIGIVEDQLRRLDDTAQSVLNRIASGSVAAIKKSAEAVANAPAKARTGIKPITVAAKLRFSANKARQEVAKIIGAVRGEIAGNQLLIDFNASGAEQKLGLLRQKSDALAVALRNAIRSGNPEANTIAANLQLVNKELDDIANFKGTSLKLNVDVEARGARNKARTLIDGIRQEIAGNLLLLSLDTSGPNSQLVKLRQESNRLAIALNAALAAGDSSAEGLAQQLKIVTRELIETSSEAGVLKKGMGGLGNNAFQLGQAFEDFSQGFAINGISGGIRGASNNILFLTQNLTHAAVQAEKMSAGLAAGLTIGLSIGAALLILILPEIEKWLNKTVDIKEEFESIERSIRRIKNSAAEAFKLESDLTNFRFDLKEIDTLTGALSSAQSYKRELARINDELTRLNEEADRSSKVQKDFFQNTFLDGIDEKIKRLRSTQNAVGQFDRNTGLPIKVPPSLASREAADRLEQFNINVNNEDFEKVEDSASQIAKDLNLADGAAQKLSDVARGAADRIREAATASDLLKQKAEQIEIIRKRTNSLADESIGKLRDEIGVIRGTIKEEAALRRDVDRELIRRRSELIRRGVNDEKAQLIARLEGEKRIESFRKRAEDENTAEILAGDDFFRKTQIAALQTTASTEERLISSLDRLRASVDRKGNGADPGLTPEQRKNVIRFGKLEGRPPRLKPPEGRDDFELRNVPKLPRRFDVQEKFSKKQLPIEEFFEISEKLDEREDKLSKRVKPPSQFQLDIIERRKRLAKEKKDREEAKRLFDAGPPIPPAPIDQEEDKLSKRVKPPSQFQLDIIARRRRLAKEKKDREEAKRLIDAGPPIPPAPIDQEEAKRRRGVDERYEAALEEIERRQRTEAGTQSADDELLNIIDELNELKRTSPQSSNSGEIIRYFNIPERSSNGVSMLNTLKGLSPALNLEKANAKLETLVTRLIGATNGTTIAVKESDTSGRFS